jgi:2-polyprenyl-3-methyl-5-hydroxy-6-metoxy-1,4-benzoquinol methylase
MNPKGIVRDGYEQIARLAEAHYRPLADSRYPEWLSDLATRLPSGARVLDLGCGSGSIVAKHLAPQFRITGIDISLAQISEARQHVPQGEFICADMTEVTFQPHSFEAVIALYSIIHIPLQQQPSLLAAIAYWLKPSGHFLATLGHTN